MIKFVSSWAEQIIIAVIVVTILEMILPKGNSKKYIKTIIGVYIVYTIISPAIKLVNGGNLKLNLSDYEKYFNTSKMTSTIEVGTVEDTYKKQIEKQLRSDVEEMGYSITKIKMDVNLDEGAIKSVTLSMKKEGRNRKRVNIDVDKVEVGNKNEKSELEDEDIEKIKQKIKEDYGVEYENITINSK